MYVSQDAQNPPPWASMMLLQMDSPIPMPSGLVVKKGSKMRSAVSYRAHRLNAVQNQIQENLLQLDAVAHNRTAGSIESRAQRYATSLQFAVGQGQHLLNNLVDVELRESRS